MIQLNADQEFIVSRAVDWFRYSHEQLFQYDGPPGSGKSVVLNEIVRRLGLNIATEVAPMSFIGAASLVMRTKGLHTAKTAHSWIFDIIDVPMRDKNGNMMWRRDGHVLTTKQFIPKDHLDPNIKLIIVDEAYCLPLTLRPIIEKFGLKILACGDANQLPPVKDKPAFLTSGKIYHLTQVMRQAEHSDILFIADRAMRRLPLLNGFYGSSLVIDREDLTDHMLLWADVVICGTNRTRDLINNHIRCLKGIGSPLPEHGDRIVCRNNNWDIVAFDESNVPISLVNGMIGTVVNQSGAREFNNKDGTFKLDFVCDIANCKFECNVNYDYMISDHQKRMALKNSPYTKGQLFEFAYAITCHIAQGSQFNKVIYIEENLGYNIQSRLNLVGATRATQQLIYVNPSDEPWVDYGDPIPYQKTLGYSRRIERLEKQLKEINQRRLAT